MKSVSRVAVFAFVCFALAACKESVEEKAQVQEIAGSDSEQGVKPRVLPECARRDKNGMYIQPGGCSGEEWIEWQKQQDAMNAPSN